MLGVFKRSQGAYLGCGIVVNICCLDLLGEGHIMKVLEDYVSTEAVRRAVCSVRCCGKGQKQ